jgi:hypothetical protein
LAGQRRVRLLRQTVNFFGHAAIASWTSPDGDVEPGVALGAMLPDFESMCGGRVSATQDSLVARGIDLHHATDAAFHRLPVVTGLMRELDDELARAGCARGPRRAVAHIGVELLLDGELVDEPRYRAAYLRGIGHDAPLQWRQPNDAARFAVLIDRLRSRGIPDDLREVDAIVQRLQRILGHRPLLAPSLDDQRAIQRALSIFQPRLQVAAATVVRAMQAALDRPA